MSDEEAHLILLAGGLGREEEKSTQERIQSSLGLPIKHVGLLRWSGVESDQTMASCCRPVVLCCVLYLDWMLSDSL